MNKFIDKYAVQIMVAALVIIYAMSLFIAKYKAT